MISTPIATSAALEQSSERFSSFDKRVGVRVWGDDRLHWRVKKMDYPVCHTIIHPHISHIHTVALVILISPGITGVYLWNVRKHRCLLSRSLVRCSLTDLLPYKRASSLCRTKHLRTENCTNLFHIHIFDSKLSLLVLSLWLECALYNDAVSVTEDMQHSVE